MKETVTTGEDVDERTELGDVHNTTLVGRTNLSGRRIEDELNLTLGLIDLGAVDRGDRHNADHAVVVDRDVGAGLGLDGVDDLALRADDLTDLLDRDLEGTDLRRSLTNLFTGLGDRLGHVVENVEAGFLRLSEGANQNGGRNTGNLRVELESRDEVSGSGNLEVHVAKGIFRTEDVGEGDVFAFCVDEAHRNTGDRRFDRHTGIHERKGRATNGGHRGRTVGGHDLGDGTHRVGPVFERRDHGEHGTLSEGTVADLATLRSTHEAGLASGEGREVVVVEVALLVDRREVVDHHVAAAHAERREVEDLGLATLEEAGTVRRRDDPNFARHRTQFVGLATIDADALFNDALAHNGLGDRADRVLDLLHRVGVVGELTVELRDDGGAELTLGVLAIGLVSDLLRFRNAIGGGGLHGGEDFVGVVGDDGGIHLDNGARGVDGLLLELDHLADPHLASLEAASEDVFVDLGSAVFVELPRVSSATGFHHHHGDIVTSETASNDHVERRFLGLCIGREGDPFALGRPAHAHRAERAVERDRR